MSEEDYRGLRRLPQGEKRPEVSILRDENPIVARRDLEERHIGSGLHPEFADMQSIVARYAKAGGEPWSQRVVYQKPQVPVSNGS